MGGKADERRRARVARLEAEARRAPGAYRTRVALLAALGYAVLGLVGAVAVALPVVVVVGMATGGQGWDGPGLLVLASLVFAAGVVLHALWVRVVPPRGFALAADHVPALTAEIERLRLAAGAPPLDGVVIDADLNAAAAACPRMFGLLGERRYLVIGLPLLRLLDRDELSAVIAHEFGHFRSDHGRFAAWVYRLRYKLRRLAEAVAFSANPLVRLLLLKFFEWYAPYFEAISFVLAREEEYEADAVARRLVGHSALASGLIRLDHASDWLRKRLWEPMPDRMRAQPRPPLSISAEQARWLRELPALDVARVIAAAEREHDVDDTHPVLARRIAAGGDAPSTLRMDGTPAVALFNASLVAEIERTLDAQWRDGVLPQWKALHAAAEPERHRLAALERGDGPAEADLLAHARLVETLRPESDPIRAYARVLARQPDNPSALFRAGALRVDAGDVAGVALLERAMTLDAGAVGPVFARLDAWRHDGSLDGAMAAELDRLRETYGTQAASLRARAGVDEDDDLVAHDLDPEDMRALIDALAGVAPVARAWLVRKRLEMTGEAPHYTLLVDWRGSVASETAGLKRLVAALRLPGSVTVFGDGDSSRRALARRVRTVCGAPVYMRG